MWVHPEVEFVVAASYLDVDEVEDQNLKEFDLVDMYLEHLFEKSAKVEMRGLVYKAVRVHMLEVWK